MNMNIKDIETYKIVAIHDNINLKLKIFQGDSGGPLVLDNKLVGIANWIEG